MALPVNFAGTAHKLDPAGLTRAASLLSIDVDRLRAVIQVETSGSGFDSHGRPRMLFEPHVFYRLLDASTDKAALNAARVQGVAYANWGAHPYPADSYPRLTLACRINDDAALRSASWGLGQIMGLNYKMLGYVSVTAMVMDACASEDLQLSQMVRFIKANNIARWLSDEDWTAFATHYNGSGQAKVYAAKLEAAYAKFTTEVKEV